MFAEYLVEPQRGVGVVHRSDYYYYMTHLHPFHRVLVDKHMSSVGRFTCLDKLLFSLVQPSLVDSRWKTNYYTGYYFW